ncbi:MAG: hypothetical protein ACK41D_05395 [Rubricoccaceae bacterium]
MAPRFPSIGLAAVVYVVVSLGLGYLLAVNPGAQMWAGGLSCVAALLVPALAVWHYVNTHGVSLRPGAGAGMGAAAIALGGLLAYGAQVALQAAGVYPSNDQMLEAARQQLLEQGIPSEQIEGALDMAMAMQGPVGMIVSVAIAAVVGAVAGAVAAAILKRGPRAEEA